MVRKPFGLNRAKCTHADVESQVGPRDALLGEANEDLVGEVEPGRRGSSRSRMLSVDGLVGEPIAECFAPVTDVGRQRGLTVSLQERGGRYIVVAVPLRPDNP